MTSAQRRETPTLVLGYRRHDSPYTHFDSDVVVFLFLVSYRVHFFLGDSIVDSDDNVDKKTSCHTNSLLRSCSHSGIKWTTTDRTGSYNYRLVCECSYFLVCVFCCVAFCSKSLFVRNLSNVEQWNCREGNRETIFHLGNDKNVSMTDGPLVSVFTLFSHFSASQSGGFHHFCQQKKKRLDKQKTQEWEMRERDKETRWHDIEWEALSPVGKTTDIREIWWSAMCVAFFPIRLQECTDLDFVDHLLLLVVLSFSLEKQWSWWWFSLSTGLLSRYDNIISAQPTDGGSTQMCVSRNDSSKRPSAHLVNLFVYRLHLSPQWPSLMIPGFHWFPEKNKCLFKMWKDNIKRFGQVFQFFFFTSFSWKNVWTVLLL